MIGVISDKRDSQIITQSTVHQILFALRFLQTQLITTLQYFEDQLLILAARLAVQVRNVLHAGRLDGRKAKIPISLFDHPDDIVTDLHLLGQDIFHSGNRFLTECHNSLPFRSIRPHNIHNASVPLIILCIITGMILHCLKEFSNNKIGDFLLFVW